MSVCEIEIFDTFCFFAAGVCECALKNIFLERERERQDKTRQDKFFISEGSE